MLFEGYIYILKTLSLFIFPLLWYPFDELSDRTPDNLAAFLMSFFPILL